jgi:hypothetical protein
MLFICANNCAFEIKKRKNLEIQFNWHQEYNSFKREREEKKIIYENKLIIIIK